MNVSRCATVLVMELRRSLGRPPLRILLVLVLGMAYLLSTGGATVNTGDASVGGQKAWITSEYQISVFMAALFPLLYMFFVSIAAGMAIPEDDELNVGPVLHATPLTAGEYIAGKFMAILLAFGLVVGANLMAMMICNHLLPHGDKAENFGPFAWGNYLRPGLLFTLPSLVGVAGVAFLLGTATRRPILVYLFPVAVILVSIFFLFNWSPSWLDRRINYVLMILDPSCLRWLRETWFNTDRGAAYYNSEPVGRDTIFWLNRGFWVMVGVGSMLLSWRWFALSLRRTPRVKVAAGAVAAATPVVRPVEGALLPALRAAVVAPGFLRGLWQVIRMETRLLVIHPGMYLFVPLILLEAVGEVVFRLGFLEFPLLSTPGDIAVSLWNLLVLSMALILLFFTVESFERERATGLTPLFASTPLKTSSIVFGKVLANSLVGVAVLLLNFLAGWGILLWENTIRMEVLPFVLVWGVLLVPTYFVWCAYVVLLQALFRARYATYGLALGTLILFGYWQFTGKLSWASNWMLWSSLRWTDMGILELDRQAIILNRIFVVSVGVLFVVIALRRYPRREQDATRLIHSFRWSPILWESAKLAPLAIVSIVLYAVLYTAVENGRDGDLSRKLAKDYWKKNLMTWRDVPVPALVDVDVALELDPPRQAFRTEGSYLIKNDRPEPLRKIPLTVGSHFKNLTWTLAGKEFEPENQGGLYVFVLEQPLKTNETVRVGFAFDGVYPFGISKNAQGAGEFILPSGVLLNSFGASFVPMVGYVEEIGLEQKDQYEPRQYEEDYHLKELPPLWGSATPFTVQLKVTGPAEYTYNGVGQLLRDDIKDDRRTMVWKSDHPVRMFNVVAGKWETEKGKGVAVNYHAQHRYNVAEMTRALEAAREHYSAWYGEYPWKELKLSQFPGLASYAQGFATNIVFSESMMLSRKDGDGDAAFIITAHEAAHQWWGNMLTPGKGPGSNILSEGLAHYSTMLLLDKVKGPRQRMLFCKRLESTYGKGRRFDAELPLVKIQGRKAGDQTVTYDKGSWAFWMLDHHLGRERMLKGLRKFMARYQFNRDHPMIEDLLDVLRDEAPDRKAFDRLSRQLFFEVRLPQYRFEDVTRTEKDDKSEVSGTLKNQGTGAFFVEVAAIKGSRYDKSGEPDPEYREERVRVLVEADGSVPFTIKASFIPDKVIVDPDLRVLQLTRDRAEFAF